MTDRPIGCLLSGGLDSSIVTAILCREIGPENVRTYSIGMEGSPDLKAARIVANHLGTIHTEVPFTPVDALEAIPEVVRVLESYDVTTVRASIGMYLLAKYIENKTDDTVIFSGEGSDELFQGYLYFHEAPCASAARLESQRLQDELHLYDVLRADRCISSCGLELRVPFLDKDVLNLVHNLSDVQLRPVRGHEKYILRYAFREFLPAQITFRTKSGFSDSTGPVERPLYKIIQDWLVAGNLYPGLSPVDREESYYRELLERELPWYHLTLPRWLPRWTDEQDPSGMKMPAFKDN